MFHSRKALLDVFSAFIQFKDGDFDGWLIAPALKRSMAVQLAQCDKTDTSNHFWALFWYGLWQQGSRSWSEGHLTAYLQETCYRVARQLKRQVPGEQFCLSDCFQMAIAKTPQILAGFDPSRGYHLSTYAARAYSTIIKEQLRRSQEIDFCSNWALLRKISRKQLTEAIAQAGLVAPEANLYLLAWRCFNALYIPPRPTANRALKEPDPETWTAIVKLYNTERNNQPYGLRTVATVLELQDLLDCCASWARAYLNPAQISIHMALGGPESQELGEVLPQLQAASVLDDLLKQESEGQRTAQQHAVYAVLANAITTLAPTRQHLLQLYYGEGLTQQRIAAQGQLKQFEISRYLSRARKRLIQALVQWSQDHLHISITPDIVNTISDDLEMWLSAFYQSSESPIPTVNNHES
ncbi:RNA polymerase sigma factor, sigma-70 family [Synechococcus sp. PCC 7335]|uniref:sigma-70 family RNA polymerase sigma factor n=1 Tax=Synechococcus sp. (strain ATCC 29403 / PCC 7335) TaxID=91464 RepID=UPI00017EDD72|nr:sigma-70 family RNA polymerase sigma factor [Synechococcus sp. PCC 7335]EDX83302.1 RNA polymerase sigma factor, sigma-70 family [Synechococcus sp. PCC 7335]